MIPISTRLRWRLLLVVVMAVVPALVAIGYLQSVERDSARRRTLAESVRLARLVAIVQGDVFDDAHRFLLTLTALPELRALDPSRCERALRDVLGANDDYGNIRVIDASGSSICAAEPAPSFSASVIGRAWFERAMLGEATVLGDVQLARSSGTPIIVVARPIMDSGRVAGVVGVSITLEHLREFAARVELPPGASVTLFDRNRRIVARFPGGDSWLGKTIPDSGVIERLRRAREDLVEAVGVDGVQRLYATVRVPATFPTGLYLGLGVSSETAFAESNSILGHYLWLMAIVTLAGMVGTVIGGRAFILGPLNALKGVADRLAAGDLSARAQLANGVGGIQDLAGAVNTMAAALDQRQAERDRAERDLRVAEERMRFALSVSGVGVWEVNFKSGVSHWSETCERMHGLEPGTFAGTLAGFLDRILEDDRALVQEAIDRAIASRTAVEFEYRTRWRDGSIHRISSTGQFFYDEDGAPVRGAGVTLEVTERRLLEEQLRQAQKMEAVGQLAGGVAHDFNNLLTIITGNTELAVTAVPEGSLAREDLEASLEAADRAANLTRQLLAFSRKQLLQHEHVNVKELVEQIVPMLRPLVGEDILVETVTGAGDMVTMADRGQLEQALINLVVNARDAMPTGGTLRIVTDRVEREESSVGLEGAEVSSGAYVSLQVIDSGCGMDAETVARAFEPFFTTKPVGEGTGLGLSSVYGTVKQFGGDIQIASAPGRGTTVSILLPCVADAEVRPQVNWQAEPVSATAATILLVEDETALRQLAARVLTEAGYTVIQAENGATALAFARDHPGQIDLMLSDVVMPGIPAAELIEGVRRARPEARVLLMSGYPNSEMVRRGFRSHEFVVMEKPFTAQRLRAHVAAALSTTVEVLSSAG